jgi:mRNA-degrading endonuclease YafQ of YafQ-DinJ toxin-antitoxin module
MTKCNCEVCQCETEEDYLKLFLKDVTKLLKSDNTDLNKLMQIQHCLEHTHVFIIELKG